VGGGFFSQGNLENLTSNSPTITVNSLPSGAPESFDNQVGKSYELEVDYSTTQLKAGEPIDVKVKVSGKGNLKQLNAPELTFPLDFDTYEPEIDGNTKLSISSGFTGSKEFNYLVIPRHHGTYEIPAFEFSYYDLNSGSYQTLSHPAQTIQVEKSANSTPATNAGSGNTVAKEDVEVINKEIRHIAYNTDLTYSETTFFRSGLFWTGITLPFVFMLGGLIFAAVRPKEKVVDKKKTASKTVLKVLKVAEQKLSEQDNLSFYEELYKGLMRYLSNKLECPYSELTKETLAAKLANKKLSDAALSIIEECEMARYTPLTQAGAQDTMSKTKNLIQEIEKHVS
jgi:hypothetical protein